MNDFVDEIYAALNGNVNPGRAIPWVENAFAEGKRCALLYEQVYEANIRLCKRLGKADEDDDVELLIGNLFEIQKILCEKMFFYGYRFGREVSK